MDDTKRPPGELDKPDDIEEQIVSLDETPGISKHLQVRLPPAKRLTLRQRKIAWRLSIGLCLLLLIMLVAPNSLTIVRNVTSQLYDRLVPPPTPTLAPSLDSFYFDVNIPWTQVTIDDRTIQIPTIGSGSPIKLAVGRHTVRWQAAPFQMQSCIITVPVQFRLSDTCLLTTDDLEQLPHPPQAQLLMLHESVHMLLANQQRELINAMQNALAQQAASTTVQPGEMYFGPMGYTTADQPLRATLRFSLDQNADSNLAVGRAGTKGIQTYTINAQDCQILCSLPWKLWLSHPTIPIANGVSSPPTWFVLAFATQRLDYATMNGHIIASDQPTDYDANVFSYPVLLGLSWDGANWHVNVYFKQDVAPFYFLTGIPEMPLYEDPACAAVEDQLSNVVSLYSQIQYFPAANVADGCLAIAKWSGTYSPAPSSLYLWFLDRFGILYPINAAATQVSYPDVPQANAYEQHLAQQLAKLPGVVVNF
jgi:hypothetical protein